MAEYRNSAEMGESAEAKPPRSVPGIRMQALLRSAAIGDVVSILMRAPKHKALSLEALCTNVLPAVRLDQHLVARIHQPGNGAPVPAGLALWATVSDELDGRLRQRAVQPPRLMSKDWNSGPHLWLIDLVAPSVLAASMLKDLDETVAKGRVMSVQATGEDGTTSVTTVKALRARLAGVKSQSRA
jgi:hemolysin-activating ACP:hemolysin acyltransferase